MWKSLHLVPCFTLYVLGVFLSSIAFGGIAVEVQTGYSPIGSLNVETSVSTRGVPVVGTVSIQADESESFVWGVGASTYFTQLFYAREGIKYSGVYNAVGLNLSFGTRFGVDNILMFQGEGLFLGQLSAKNRTFTVVNGQEFQHATVVTYKNSQPSKLGVLGRVGLISDIKGGQFNKRQFMRFGLSLDYLHQPFDLQNTDVRTSNASVFPGEKTQTAVSYSLSLLSLNFLVGFVF
ncbi:MAG: hypothetical protein HYW48_00385 [Deltaproteobacteria bacterium]|nr:hypothetical protein [Deltaproteobacteria bacterium]